MAWPPRSSTSRSPTPVRRVAPRRPIGHTPPMSDPAIPVVIISGPVGVGKSSVGQEISDQLQERAIAHTFVDFDALAQTSPRPADDPYGTRLGSRNLMALWRNAAEAGSQNLIVAYVIETERDLEAITSAVPGANSIVVQLQASDAALAERVRKREIGSAHDWHANRAIELARSLALTGPADMVVQTDGRGVVDIAREIVERIGWRRTGG